MKSQVVERHQKVLSAKPKNDELYLHPAAASEGGVGKQNACGVVVSVVVCTYVCVYMSCRRNRKPSRQAAMGETDKGDHSRNEPRQTPPFGECQFCLF